MKRRRTTDSGVTMGRQIGTHDGAFHCDEVLATALLKKLPQWRDATIVRSRDLDILASCDIVVDVGAEYDPDRLRFDHHQRSFNEYFSPDRQTTKLSSAGLVYKHFGEELLRDCYDVPADVLPVVYKKFYKQFVEAVDAEDNGVAIAEGGARYHVDTSLGARVSKLNIQWNETPPEGEDVSTFTMKRFVEAQHMAVADFERSLRNLVQVVLPARRIVEDAIATRFETHPSGQIIKLERGCPFIEHVFDIETEQALEKEILYAIYPDKKTSWMVRALPKPSDRFQNRKSLPSSCHGLRGDDLCKASGLQNMIFVHASGFIGAAGDEMSALQLAAFSLQSGDEDKKPNDSAEKANAASS